MANTIDVIVPVNADIQYTTKKTVAQAVDEIGLQATETAMLDGALVGTVVNSKAAIYDATGKLYRSSATPAGAGTIVTDATALTAELNYVTGANGIVGVVLPVAAANEVVTVVNSVTTAGNFLKVYAITGSQINALGSTVAFQLNPGQIATFIGRSATLWNVASASDTISGLTASAAELNTHTGVVAGTVSASKVVVVGASKNVDTLAVALTSVGAAGMEAALTAHAGGTQAAALALSATKSYHEATIVASAGDSLALPLATGSGNIHWVKNSAAVNSLQLYGSGTDTIDGVATATGVAILAGKSRLLIDDGAGTWESMLGA